MIISSFFPPVYNIFVGVGAYIAYQPAIMLLNVILFAALQPPARSSPPLQDTARLFMSVSRHHVAAAMWLNQETP
jgi:hypothetical protein